MFEVSHRNVREAGMSADGAGADLAADQEHGGGAAVVRAFASVLLSAAAELGEGHHEKAVTVAAFGQVLEEGGHGAGKLSQQVGVSGRLRRVGVEIFDGHVENSGT